MQVPKNKMLLWTLGLGLASLILAASAACGGGTQSAEPEGDEASHAGGKADVVIDVSLKNLRFTPDAVEVAAGKTVQVNVTNMDGTEHDMLVDGLRIQKVGEATGGHHAGATADMLVVHVTANDQGSITFRTDQKGTYRFYCTLPGHKDAGMVGEMKVV
ncbi:MAG: cupredoxin domain-containing protein [Chloroflexi bacterium]|nr:cupredoxin domain-containing protein [Chloroflexota bacterium]